MDYNTEDISIWQAKLIALQHDQQINSFLTSISKSSLQLVRNDNKNALGSEARNCHSNVQQFVEKHGGEAIYGWIILPGEARFGENLKGSTWAIFHCNWRSPSNDLANITLPFDGTYQFFLPDPNRAYNFDKDEGYNSRVSYTREFIKNRNITHLSPNVTYYTAGEFASRDRIYEKFTRVLSMDAVLEHVPAAMKVFKNGQWHVTPEGKKYMTLKFNVNFEK